MSTGTKVFTITFARAVGDNGHEWRWSMSSRGRIVGASTEGYEGRQDCLDNCESVTGFTFEKPAGAPHMFGYKRVRDREVVQS